jgi:molybdate transport system substrate-binding protein
MRFIAALLLLVTGFAFGQYTRAEQALVAVAANFAPAMDALRVEFEAGAAHSLTIITGSTGGLYAQIVNGAPFDLFIAADQRRPALLEDSGYAVEGSRTTIADGRLVLWSLDRGAIETQGLEILRRGAFRHLAIANPELAPYGAAAEQALASMNLWQALAAKLVRGASIAQTFAMVATHNAEFGLVALSQVIGGAHGGAYVLIPDTYHDPIRQDFVLLRHGADNAAALAAQRFLSSDSAAEIIRSYGYSIAD